MALRMNAFRWLTSVSSPSGAAISRKQAASMSPAETR
jgi:hypothetical protein